MNIETAKKLFGTHYKVHFSVGNSFIHSISEGLGSSHNTVEYADEKCNRVSQIFGTVAEAQYIAAKKVLKNPNIEYLEDQDIKVEYEDFGLGTIFYVGWDFGRNGIALDECTIERAYVSRAYQKNDNDITHNVSYYLRGKHGSLNVHSSTDNLVAHNCDTYDPNSLVCFSENRDNVIKGIRNHISEKASNFEKSLSQSVKAVLTPKAF